MGRGCGGWRVEVPIMPNYVKIGLAMRLALEAGFLIIFSIVKQLFNILIVLVLTVFSTQSLVANDVFVLTEKSYASVKDINNAGDDLLTGVKNTLKLSDSQWAKFELKFKNNTEFLGKIKNNPSYIKAIQRIEEGGVDLISHQNYTRYIEKMARYQDEIVAGGEGVVKYYRVQTSHPLSKYLSVDGSELKFHKETDLNISISNKLHAEEYAAKKFAKEPDGGFVEIIEFEVPKSIDLEIKKAAIPQDKYKNSLLNSGKTAPKIVDPTTKGNPFELPLKWRNKIKDNYISGSAKTISKQYKK
ncbi:hypothetical protein ABW636_06300 [Aquimarina sp. 2201CG1-2-11]|uniref:hypothetical protein n=1 Tax=Aquimarina discodermiae TaxID=3231043 RepID=UPI0034636D3F